jgi:hypothetical protein
MDRLCDKVSWCRSCVLGVMSDLTEENVIPNNYLKEFLNSACSRIKDTSATVRKKALTLINNVIRVYYVIYVESQNKTKFISSEEV